MDTNTKEPRISQVLLFAFFAVVRFYQNIFILYEFNLHNK